MFTQVNNQRNIADVNYANRLQTTVNSDNFDLVV